MLLVSEVVRNLAGTMPGVTYKDRGRHEFKGWDDRWRLYQVVWPDGPVARPKERKRNTSRWLIAVAVVLAAVIAAVIALATSGGTGHTSLKSLPRNSVGRIDPASDTLDRAIPVPAGPAAIASHGTELWVGSADAQSVTRIDEQTGKQTTIPVSGHPTSIVADSKGVWVAELANRKLQRVDLQFGHVTETIGVAAAALAVGPDGLYDTVAGTTVERRDLATGALLAKRSLDLGAVPLALSGSTLWVGAYSAQLQALDPTKLISLGPPITLTSSPIALAASGGSLWTVNEDGAVQQVSVTTSSIVGTRSVPNGASIAATSGSAFVAVPSAGEVVHVGASRIPIGATPRALVAGAGGVWVAAS